MSDRPTLETDAFSGNLTDCINFAEKLEREHIFQGKISNGITVESVPPHFARKLERERDEARNKMADALQEIDLRTLDFERMKQERDEAREENAFLLRLVETIRDKADLRYNGNRGLLAFSDLKSEARRSMMEAAK